MEFLYGHWAVLESLRARRRKPDQLLIADRIEERGKVAEIIQMAQARRIDVKRVTRRILDDLSNGANHQGTLLRVSPYPYMQLEDVLNLATARGERPFVLLLDLLKDPQNVGALIRVADAVGVHGVIMQDRRSASVTPAVVNASSGAVEHIHVVQVTNLVNTMKDLKKHDIWLVGMEAGPDVPALENANLNMALGLVMGSEGEGMRRLVRETCDLLMSLPMRGHVASLNVATAGAVALYAAFQARGYT
ncbi:MAG: 23S rRNA (guanosine(2251)-2'-O)-methyltransferase RlmB [Chloroflexi bacterium]|jgi:23S rRNA (guanosine2251-2'-O)-methyltransferase|nr:MAG: RNA methyltransferase [Chloroflexi bacterium OLB13]MBC6957128.1 23S rRNA (guanosine(2251)-2'-O)-methyltransferase RlmB [Chloroflexota bacterium]MBV6438188.1 putative TrmH family tRNA/rRNA methyltransferase [Anaerolineae bacterium]MDL1916721.1 23S rRNA (guanosine(2251)-2'-O)-methyltransferase RlmB [Anaerolineae bacterium CFX4]OQY82841.1 MAG: 23S rRNA (guanosine(2251)-2'-O)-methyltransferase RlmB [Anaerolineae bacterium UTCFX5]